MARSKMNHRNQKLSYVPVMPIRKCSIKMISFTITTKTTIYLRIDIKNLQTLYEENYKSLLQDIRENGRKQIQTALALHSSNYHNLVK